MAVAVGRRTGDAAARTRETLVADALSGCWITLTMTRASSGASATDASVVAIAASPAGGASARAITSTAVGAFSAVLAEASLIAVGTIQVGRVTRTTDAIGIEDGFTEAATVIAGTVAVAVGAIASTKTVADGAATAKRPHTTRDRTVLAPVAIDATIAGCTFPVSSGSVLMALTES